MLRRFNNRLLLGLLVGFGAYHILSSFLSVLHTGHNSLPVTRAPREQGRPSDPDDLLMVNRAAMHVHGDIPFVGEGARAIKFQDLEAHHDDDIVAMQLARRVRVLVWVMTSPPNLDKKAIHVRNTWAKRPNTMLFMSSQWNSSFPTIGLNVTEGRQHLTAKTMQAFKYIYEHHFDDADWFMKADDDTYVIVENLRYLLSSYDPREPIYLGHKFKVIVKGGYTSGGAGYVISKETLRRLVTIGMKDKAMCKQDGGAEDVEFGRCLQNLKVRLVPSVDKLGRSRFHCLSPDLHLQGGFPAWYKQYDANGAKSGIESISDYAVSFHYIKPRMMYAMEFFIYHQISTSPTIQSKAK